MSNISNSNNNSVIYYVFKNQYLVKQIGREIHTINQIEYSGRSFRINQIPSLKWVLQNNTGALIHELCKKSLENDQRSLLSGLQSAWITLESVIAVCSPDTYHKSITFQMDTFDKIFTYYQSAFEQEHFAVDNAVLSGNFELVEYLLDKGTPFTTDAIDNACSKGYLDIIQLLLKTTPRNDPLLFDDNVKFTNNAYDNAATNGHLNVILYLDQLREQYQKGESKYRVEFTVKAIDGAAKNKHWNVINHILDKYKKDGEMKGYLYTDKAIRWSVGHGHLETLQKLLSFAHPDLKNMLKGGKCIADGVSDAAGQGHLDMIKYVYTANLLEIIPENALASVAQENQIEIARYFIDLFKTTKSKSIKTHFTTSYALHYVAMRGHVEMFQMFVSVNSQGQIDYPRMFELASNHGRVELLRWMFDSFQFMGATDGLVNSAAIKGRLDVLMFLVIEKSMFVFQDDIEAAAGTDHTDCLEFLLSNYSGKVSHRALKLACSTGLEKNVRLILTYLDVTGTHEIRSHLPSCFDAAVLSGSIECVEIIRGLCFVEDGAMAVTNTLIMAMERGHVHMLKYYTTVDYILSLKERCASETDDGGGQVKYIELDRNRFDSPAADLLQTAINQHDLPMVEIILARRPLATSSEPEMLLVNGYIDIIRSLRYIQSAEFFPYASIYCLGHLVLHVSKMLNYSCAKSIQDIHQTARMSSQKYMAPASHGNITLLRLLFLRSGKDVIIIQY
ncbi:hypothetical protein DFA_06229 [Cavenderia fasciculata]|uniref:Ankyrin repeat-containing protein n=1 Tax=Cavenderia fasciculata TaxID=261658 RepID=F4PKG6_CACFS|nr:uncharacterized protein DFA_06229 [Cavenderia fasciculata]EGG24090.1 hypothetical protein DFA_06229 [Cavenderia fasciculata]|eukprot:XP_004361941.1 hypothetical protein DFA_06229 [Cavenderia fasciculata]